eukprot:02116.XXX_19023_33521_1 [CDS] Oithona nana genome sequencing.
MCSTAEAKMSCSYRFLASILLCTIIFGKTATGIRLHNVDIPPHAIRGQNARLTCKYDMEGDKLYSIKWYRNGHEFYRYIPSDNPSTTIFNGNGINVDKSQSSEEEILLRSVDLDTTGLYRCEISGEAPLFQTASREAVLAVVDLPDEGPVITGGFPRYHIGDKVEVNCTSKKSKPAAKLKWYINGEQADPDLVKHFPVSFEDRGLETSTLGLRFKVRDKHFKHGDLKLKCTAVIATIYWKSNEESVQGVRPQSALVSESRSSRNSATPFDPLLPAKGSTLRGGIFTSLLVLLISTLI